MSPFDRRRAFQESRDDLHGRTPIPPQRTNQWTILFGLFPLLLLFYVWNSVQEERDFSVDNAHKKAILGGSLWDSDPNVTDYDDDDDNPFGSSLPPVPITGLWIEVQSWKQQQNGGREMSSWKRSFSQVLNMAIRLDAVLVEPGIKDGKLTTCHKGNLQFSEVYNRTIITTTSGHNNNNNDYHAKLASCFQYDAAMNQLTDPKIFDLCLNNDKFMGCTNPEGVDLESEYGQSSSTGLEQALEYVLDQESRQQQQQQHKAMVLLRIHDFAESALDKFTIPTSSINRGVNDNNNHNEHKQQKRVPLIDKKEATATTTKFLEKQYRFIDQHYDFLETHLEAVGITTDSCAVIQWVPPPALLNDEQELRNCGQDIVRTKQAMDLPLSTTSTTTTTPFLLISSLFTSQGSQQVSLNEDDGEGTGQDETITLSPQVQIDASSQTTPAAVAAELSTLFKKHEILRLEHILPPLSDIVLYEVMELILAEKALAFATCSDQCSHSKSRFTSVVSSCSSCNNNNDGLGSFSTLALSVRDGETPNTFPCWPEPVSDSKGLLPDDLSKDEP